MDNYDAEKNLHCHNNIYAPIDNLFLLKNPIDISEFRSFITVSRGGTITAVLGESFEKLKALILSRNNIKHKYFLDSTATPIPLKNINSNNWLSVSGQYRRRFMLEVQFREFFVNYLLNELSDIQNIFRECECIKTGDKGRPRVDNVILINGKYLPVEIKINLSAESDIVGQVSKYCNIDELVLNSATRITDTSKIYNCNVLIIDIDSVYLYTDTSHSIEKIFDLSTLDNTKALRKIIIEKLSCCQRIYN